MKWVKDTSGNPTSDIDFCIKGEEFIKEIEKAMLYAANSNGWVHLRICKNATPEGKGQYTHKLKVVD